MGLFDAFSNLGGTFDALSERVTGAIDGLESTLNTTSEATDQGIAKVQTVTETVTQQVDDILPGSKN